VEIALDIRIGVTLAKKLQEHIRKSDLICRWGGEEFTILFPDTNLEGAMKISEKIRLNIEETNIELKNNLKLSYTVSIGVSEIKKDDDIDSAILKADNALYRAKNSGRNMVCSS